MSYYIHIQSYKPIPGDKQAKTADGLFGTPYEAVSHTVGRREDWLPANCYSALVLQLFNGDLEAVTRNN